MIGSHPSALAAGEVKRLPKNIALNTRCSCGERIKSCPFWSPIVEQLGGPLGVSLWQDPYALELGLFRSTHEVDRARQTKWYLLSRTIYAGWLDLLHSIGIDLSRSIFARRYQKWIAEHARVHDAMRAKSGSSLLADSSKDLKAAVGLYRARPETTRIILLSRDGRGVMASNLRSGSSLKNSLNSWTKYYDRALRWLEHDVRPEHVLRVYYENLVMRPEVELRRVYDFLNLPVVSINGEFSDRNSHILAGNKNTLKTASIKADERWRKELSADQLAYFHRHGAKTMSGLGYSLEGAGSDSRGASVLQPGAMEGGGGGRAGN